MSDLQGKPSGINHKRNFIMIVSAGIFTVIGWNAVAAVQCNSRGGDIQINGPIVGCVLDYSQG